jgi:hypothetical protein
MLKRNKTASDRQESRTTARLRRVATDNPLADADARDVRLRLRTMVYGNGSRD